MTERCSPVMIEGDAEAVLKKAKRDYPHLRWGLSICTQTGEVSLYTDVRNVCDGTKRSFWPEKARLVKHLRRYYPQFRWRVRSYDENYYRSAHASVVLGGKELHTFRVAGSPSIAAGVKALRDNRGTDLRGMPYGPAARSLARFYYYNEHTYVYSWPYSVAQ